MSGPERVTTQADMSKLLAHYELWAPHRVPLIEAAMYAVISLGEVTRKGVAPVKDMDRTGHPGLIVIGDDDGVDSGPAGWACARRVVRWARLGFVHATGGTVDSYRWAVTEAVACRRLVLVETGTAHVMAWHKLFADAGVPTINLIPSDGGPHPIPVKPESLH